jgi:retron-type reverse transcriptase
MKYYESLMIKIIELSWKYDWVIDLDIMGFFDTIDHELMLKAVNFHSPPLIMPMI